MSSGSRERLSACWRLGRSPLCSVVWRSRLRCALKPRRATASRDKWNGVSPLRCRVRGEKAGPGSRPRHFGDLGRRLRRQADAADRAAPREHPVGHPPGTEFCRRRGAPRLKPGLIQSLALYARGARGAEGATRPSSPASGKSPAASSNDPINQCDPLLDSPTWSFWSSGPWTSCKRKTRCSSSARFTATTVSSWTDGRELPKNEEARLERLLVWANG